MTELFAGPSYTSIYVVLSPQIMHYTDILVEKEITRTRQVRHKAETKNIVCERQPIMFFVYICFNDVA